MRVSRLLRPCPAILVLSVLPHLLGAQTIPSAYRFIDTKQEYGLFAGYAKYATGRFGYGPGPGLLVGGRYAVRLKGPLDFEAAGTIFQGKRDVMDPGLPAGQRKIGTTSQRIGIIDVGLRFSLVGDRTWHGLNPFIHMDGGLALPLSGVTNVDRRLPSDYQYVFQSTFDALLGAGTRYFVTRKVSLRADATFGLWQIHTPPGFADPSLGFTNSARSEWVDGVRLTLAVLLNR